MPKDKRVNVTIDLCPVEVKAIKLRIARLGTYETVPEYLKGQLHQVLDSAVGAWYAARAAGVEVSE